MTRPELLAQVLRLPAEDRAQIAHELLRSLDGEPEPGVAEAWDAEIERRAAEVEADTAETMTFEEYRRRFRMQSQMGMNRSCSWEPSPAGKLTQVSERSREEERDDRR